MPGGLARASGSQGGQKYDLCQWVVQAVRARWLGVCVCVFLFFFRVAVSTRVHG